jgi:hypothetical protein
MTLSRNTLWIVGSIVLLVCSPPGWSHAADPPQAAVKAKAADKTVAADRTRTAADADSTMKLHGGEEGTIFKSLRIEGEDRVRIEFERPPLALTLDPKTAPGLDWESFVAVLDRKGFDFTSPYLAQTALTPPPRFAWPWFDRFAAGAVARFRPAVEGVESWRLTVADSRGETVANFEGNGKLPKEIAWNGRSLKGQPVPPGFTYSYVLEAYDRAGNKRNFVGDGFDIPPYIVQTPDGIEMLFSGSELARGSSPSSSPDGAVPPRILLEAASRINQTGRLNDIVRVKVTARTFEDAKATAGAIVGYLQPLILGDPLRVQPVTVAEPDAPDAGTVAIALTPRVK